MSDVDSRLAALEARLNYLVRLVEGICSVAGVNSALTGATPTALTAAKPAAKSEPAQSHLAERQRFLDAFGPRGEVWLNQGMTFDDAQALYLAMVPSPRR
jgi:hypothetical protein